MSYRRTNELVQGISDDHDIEVQYWKDELVNYVEPTSQVNSCLFLVFYWLNNSIMYILQVKKPASSSMLLLNESVVSMTLQMKLKHHHLAQLQAVISMSVYRIVLIIMNLRVKG